MKRMTLMEHFSELRRRILWTFAWFFMATIVGWYFSPLFQEFLTAPLLSVWPGGAVLYTGLADGLMIRLSLAVMFGLVLSMPMALWNVWAFVAPGLRRNERAFIWPIMILSPLLFICGAAFAFYVLVPFAFRFFIELNASSPVPAVVLPAARDYLRFAIKMLQVFGIAFQLPLVMVLLNRAGVLPRRAVARMRRYAIVIIVIAAAVLTPPDVVSQILLALPMWALFELGLMFMRRDD